MIPDHEAQGRLALTGTTCGWEGSGRMSEHNGAHRFGPCELYLADAFEWLDTRPDNSVHSIVTDPPYGLKEYTESEKRKLRAGRGGVWRIPPSFDGCKRRPIPRFTVLDQADHTTLKTLFLDFAKRAIRVLVPGGHVFIATNPLLSHLVYVPFMEAGFEKRGEIIRLVGADPPWWRQAKNAHAEFQNVTVMPRSGWEPWGLFRKPCQGRVQDNLRKWKTGGLRRISEHEPFSDVIRSAPTRGEERSRRTPRLSRKPLCVESSAPRFLWALVLCSILSWVLGQRLLLLLRLDTRALESSTTQSTSVWHKRRSRPLPE
jgi:hypothetical protein